MTEIRTWATPHGDARLHVDRSRSPRATLFLQHGAGGGPDAPDLVALARALPGQGITVIRLEQPWRVAGRRIASAPGILDTCAVAVVDRLRSRTPLVLGGRSAGARSSCRTAHHLGASAVLALSFPLHPPGKPERSRADELAAVTVPTLVVQGERDPFGTPAEFAPTQPLVVVPSADHGLKTPKRSGVSAEDVAQIVVESALELIEQRVL
ncbi:hydrolase [Nocardioides sp. HDW12B]|uniref:alpha/beta hydrolase family protein n=1 Tax=Nocardioides sp. HDW12B TaxID=2714939 RepID=UPI00140DFD62|nr:alpha/beta family hydrolase [Nocardioides sp. HDW12B]QIK67137.1 hydrolase [Nocardioides sp. HDW12B]